jgi:hypothetical protein
LTEGEVVVARELEVVVLTVRFLSKMKLNSSILEAHCLNDSSSLGFSTLERQEYPESLEQVLEETQVPLCHSLMLQRAIVWVLSRFEQSLLFSLLFLSSLELFPLPFLELNCWKTIPCSKWNEDALVTSVLAKLKLSDTRLAVAVIAL